MKAITTTTAAAFAALAPLTAQAGIATPSMIAPPALSQAAADPQPVFLDLAQIEADMLRLLGGNGGGSNGDDSSDDNGGDSNDDDNGGWNGGDSNGGNSGGSNGGNSDGSNGGDSNGGDSNGGDS